jgi:crotonobetainyl-CoA:carnitine CoA-transferase CaiB-like acyl-CoA transferase
VARRRAGLRRPADLEHDQTGEGQFVDTSIVYAHLLNASMAWSTPDGSGTGDRQRLDAMQYGWSALYGLYRAADGWLCLAALTEPHWTALCDTVGRPELAVDDRFATPGARRRHDPELRADLAAVFAEGAAAEWFKILDAAGVPCELTSTDFVHGLFDDPEWRDKGWVTTYEHGRVGRMDVFGLLFDFSETPGRIAGPPPLVGEHTNDILAEVGYTADETATLLADGAAFDRP